MHVGRSNSFQIEMYGLYVKKLIFSCWLFELYMQAIQILHKEQNSKSWWLAQKGKYISPLVCYWTDHISSSDTDWNGDNITAMEGLHLKTRRQ